MTTKILRCGCKHPGQDALHGPGQRVHNWAEKAKQWRCTICKTPHSDQAEKAKPEDMPKKKSKKKGKADKKK